MVTTQSSPIEIGSSAAEFSLPDTRNGQLVHLSQFSGQPILIAFICNHCPYVIHLLEPFTSLAHELAESGIATVAICSNDAGQYPADSPENMARLASEQGFDFPYCHDESQEVAKTYCAVCTPDLFLYSAEHKLYYRGQFDNSRPGQGQASGQDLRQAAMRMSSGAPAPEDSVPSVGCSIKWRR